MITLRIDIIEYDKRRNVCKAKLLNGDIVELDPYVLCAIALSDEDYEAGKGADIVGNAYLLVDYSVTRDGVFPCEGGMILLS